MNKIIRVFKKYLMRFRSYLYSCYDSILSDSDLFNLFFDANFYLTNNPDVADANIDPLLHYINYGWKEGRDPSPIFATNYYLASLTNDMTVEDNPISHFIRYGVNNNISPNPLFDSKYYREKYNINENNPFIDYLQKPFVRNPHPLFDTEYYLSKHPDLTEKKISPLYHFFYYGLKNGEKINSNFNLENLKENNILKECLSHSIWGRASDFMNYLPAEAENTEVCSYSNVVDVIIPVYRDLQATKRCVESVIKAKNNCKQRIIVINDCSPEPEVSEYLSSIKGVDNFLLLINEDNLGFVKTVNKGMSQSEKNDVLLLNSDTEVSDYWLDRIIAHSFKDKSVGTVVPLSNNSTICNFPNFDGYRELLGDLTLKDISDLCYASNAGRAVQIPTSVGYCMFISRECLNQVGLFDYEAFGKGYGEENDFCERATLNGWKHLLAADVFVFHEGEKSFKGSAEERKKIAHQILLDRYPWYDENIASFFRFDPMYPFRVAIFFKALQQFIKNIDFVFTLESSINDLDSKMFEKVIFSYQGEGFFIRFPNKICSQTLNRSISPLLDPVSFSELITILNVRNIYIDERIRDEQWILKLTNNCQKCIKYFC